MSLRLVCSLALLGVSWSATVISADSDSVQWVGRNVKPGDGSVHFDWVGVGARLRWSGTWLKATFSVTGSSAVRPFKLASSQWVVGQNYYVPSTVQWVVTNDADNGTVTVTIATGEGGTAVMDTWTAINSPPQYWTGSQSGVSVAAVSFSTDGSFASAGAPFTRFVEFIGDSITAATNVHSHPPCGDFGWASDYANSWSGLIALNFTANSSTVAVGGKGLIRNCCDNSLHMPDYFRQSRYASSGPDYEFAATGFIPQAMVIALGTNDYSGTTPAGFDAQFTSAYVQFMQNVTRWYGAANEAAASAASNITFFCAVGPMTDAYANATLAAVAQATSLGLRAVYVDLMGAPTDGCAGHPGVEGHHAMATIARSVIAQTMGW